MKGVDNKVHRPPEVNEFIQSAVINHSLTIVKVAFSYLKNTADAEDIVQEVFFTLMQKQPELENEEHLKAWLIRVAINKCKNHLKSGWLKKNSPLEGDITYLPPEQNEILSTVLSLDVKYRIPIHLYYYQGYSIKEIGEIMSVPAPTIGTRLARGRKLLKSIMGGLDDE